VEQRQHVEQPEKKDKRRRRGAGRIGTGCGREWSNQQRLLERGKGRRKKGSERVRRRFEGDAIRKAIAG
jgi:hypothetical protein